MLRPREERSEARRLADAGLNASQVAAVLGIPRTTVRDWLNGRVSSADCGASPDDARCTRCGHPPHDFRELPEAEYSLLLGFYLGDGTISAGQRGVYALRIVNDNRYPAITAECATAMAAVMPTSRVGFVRKVGCVEIVSVSKAWACLFPQCGPGPKHTRPIVLTEWQSEIVARRPHQFIRGLLMSDGCRITNFATTRYGRRRYEYPRYLFSNASGDIRDLFCSALAAIGVGFTKPKQRHISVARARSVAFLDRFVGPKS